MAPYGGGTTVAASAPAPSLAAGPRGEAAAERRGRCAVSGVLARGVEEWPQQFRVNVGASDKWGCRSAPGVLPGGAVGCGFILRVEKGLWGRDISPAWEWG